MLRCPKLPAVPSKKRLPSAPRTEGLGLRTIMDPALAQRHGVPYVHLAAFAIDVDRVRDAVEGFDDPRPFGWEVLLTEAYLQARFDPIRRPEQVLLFEDVVLSILEGEPDALGAQLVFAIWDGIVRGRFPKRLEEAFAGWKTRPKELVKDLAKLWAEGEARVAALAAGCLDVPLEPPLAPPTREALEALRDGPPSG
ncbi:MAG TPA: hypothetical protein RMH99_19195 [Sandaracinaceae bacterium LLY-WYZ-13_1]|nr:hypothetical protein [Sandaracinaceae bacterium LLY-WYZ-13_1]